MHADAHPASRTVGDAILRAGEMGWLTTANVQSATALSSLTSAVTNGSSHADQQPLKSRINQLIQIGSDDGTLTTAAIQAATGVSNLASLTEVNETGRSYGAVE